MHSEGDQEEDDGYDQEDWVHCCCPCSACNFFFIGSLNISTKEEFIFANTFVSLSNAKFMWLPEIRSLVVAIYIFYESSQFSVINEIESVWVIDEESSVKSTTSEIIELEERISECKDSDINHG